MEKGGTHMQHCFRLFTELLYNLTADVEKRQRNQPSRAFFTQNGSQISQVSQRLRLDINREECRRYTAYVKVKSDPRCLFFPLVLRVTSTARTLVLTLARVLFWFLIYLCGLQPEQQSSSTNV